MHTRSSRSRRHIALFAAVTASAAGMVGHPAAVHADTFTWAGAAGNSYFSLSGNWTNSSGQSIAPPNNGTAALVFSSTNLDNYNPTDDVGYKINSLNFSSNAISYKIQSSFSLTIGSGGLIDNAAVNESFVEPITGSAAITVNGAGTLTLGGTNTYIGGTNVYGGGTLSIPAGVAAGTSTSPVLVGGPVGTGISLGGNLSSSSMTVGYNSVGQISHSTGLDSVAGELDLGVNATGSGTYLLYYLGNLSATTVVAGDNGTGSVVQSDSSTYFSTTSFILGNAAAGNGTYNLSAGTLAAGNMTAGNLGSGTIVQSGGANNITSNLYLGYGQNSVGTYNMTGGNLSAPSLTVGYDGRGTFLQSNGSTSSTTLTVGADLGSGIYNLSGGSLSAQAIIVGNYRSGTFIQSGGSVSGTDTLYIGSYQSGGLQSGANGSYSLTAGTLSIPRIIIGTGGTGSFSQTGGSANASTSVTIGSDATGTGTYSISAGNLSTGTLTIGQGSFYLSGTGSVTVSGTTGLQGPGQDNNYIYQFGGSFSTSTLNITPYINGISQYTLSGGTLNANNVYVGYKGTASFIQSNGSNISPTVTLGTNGGVGTYSLTGGSIGSTSFIVGYNASGSVVQSAGSNAAATIALGAISGGSGTYNLTGGTVTPTSFIVGYNSSGNVLQSNGSVTATTLTLGDATSSSGTYNLTGGTLSATTAYVGYNGSGTVLQSGGSLTGTGTLSIASGGAASSSSSITGSYGLSAGLVSMPTIRISQFGAGSFSQTGGTVNASSGVYLGSSSAFGTGTYVITGGTLNTGNLNVENGTFYLRPNGTVNASGSTILAANAGATGIVLQTGGVLTTGTLSLNASFSQSQAIYNLGGGTLATANVSGQYLTNNGLGAFLILDGGTLRATGNSSNFITGVSGVPVFATSAFDTNGFAVSISNSLGASVIINSSIVTSPGGLNKIGSGALTLSGTQFYTGATNVSAGALLLTGALDIGQGESGVSSPVIVDGPAGTTFQMSGGSAFVDNSSISIGSSNTGVFIQTGGLVDNAKYNSTASEIAIGGPGGTGVYNLSGGVLFGQTLDDGAGGTGAFIQSGGNSNFSSAVYVGHYGPSTATLTLSGGNLSTPSLYLGYDDNTSGTVIQTGGTVTASIVQLSSSPLSDGIYNLAGGLLITPDVIAGGGTSTLYLAGGTLQPTGNNASLFSSLGTVYVSGSQPTTLNTGAFNISISAPLLHDPALGATVDGGLTTSGSGTLNLTGASTYTGPTYIGGGTVNLTAGTIGSNTSNFSIAGAAGTTLNLSGPSTVITAAQLLDGLYYSGSVYQSAGAVNASISVLLAYGTGSVGGYNFAGGTINSPQIVDGFYGTGTFNQTGGTATIQGPVYLGYGGTGTYTLTGGTLTAGQFQTVNGNGTLNLSGGTLIPANNSSAFVSVTNAYLGSSATTINTNGYNISIGQPLLHSGAGTDGGLIKSGAGTLTLSQYSTSDYTGATTITGGKLLVAGPSNSSGPQYASFTTVNVAAGAALGLAPHASGSSAFTTVIGSLTLASPTFSGIAGDLEISNEDAVLTGGNLSVINAEAAFGYAGGTWNGAGGITSTTAAADSRHLTAVGVIANSPSAGVILFGSTRLFGTYAPAAGDVLVKYTYYGDANLDGKVDGSDYSLIDAGYASHGTLTGWYHGDFNYDGVINGSDYTLIDNAFNNQGTVLSAQVAAQVAKSATAAVPEPATFGLGSMVLAASLGRRRRRKAGNKA